MRGYYGIGIEHTKTEVNVGTLWRSAQAFDAAFIFTIGHRYHKQASDTTHAFKHLPLYNYVCFEDFYLRMPYECRLVGVELDPHAKPIANYVHPERAIYLLGAEDVGLSKLALSKCHDLLVIPSAYCLNVAVAGSIVMYDRTIKRNHVPCME